MEAAKNGYRAGYLVSSSPPGGAEQSGCNRHGVPRTWRRAWRGFAPNEASPQPGGCRRCSRVILTKKVAVRKAARYPPRGLYSPRQAAAPAWRCVVACSGKIVKTDVGRRYADGACVVIEGHFSLLMVIGAALAIAGVIICLDW